MAAVVNVLPTMELAIFKMEEFRSVSTVECYQRCNDSETEIITSVENLH